MGRDILVVEDDRNISDLIQTGDSFSPHCLNLIAAG